MSSLLVSFHLLVGFAWIGGNGRWEPKLCAVQKGYFEHKKMSSIKICVKNDPDLDP